MRDRWGSREVVREWLELPGREELSEASELPGDTRLLQSVALGLEVSGAAALV